MDTQVSSPPAPDYTPVGLVLPRDGHLLSWEAWRSMGHTLHAMEGGLPWWWGDWLNYGERAYGETYTQAIEVTGHKLQRLMNYKWVANAVDISVRRAALSWTHHRYVARLLPSQQRRWLGMAEAQGWSSTELLHALRADRMMPSDATLAEISTRVDLSADPVILVPARWQRLDDGRVLLQQDEQAIMLSPVDLRRLLSWAREENLD